MIKSSSRLLTILAPSGIIPPVASTPNSNILFSGSSSISVPHHASLNLGSAFTLECFIKPASGSYYRTIMAKRNGNQSNYQYLIFPSGVVGFGDGASGWTSTYSPTVGVWVHIALIFSGGMLTLVVNGVFHSTFAGGVGATNSAPLHFGNIPNGFEPFPGNMDDMRVWNIARTVPEILANYNKELVGNESGLVSYFKYNEGTGATTTDSTANAHVGTLNGGAAWATA